MTSDPKAPDAAAVYLFREEIVDDKMHFHRVYARVKILTEKGKEEFGDIEIPYESGTSSVYSVDARTIHSDGTVIPFTGKPYDKELVKTGGVKMMAKVFSMPDVQVGSILEYRWELQYRDNWLLPPNWTVQQSIYLHEGHYHFVAASMGGNRIITTTDALGKEHPANALLYYHWLPPGMDVKSQVDGYDLVVNDIPPVEEEEDSPPLGSFAYRVIFYYSPDYTRQDFWKLEGKEWSKDVDRFANPSDKIRQAVSQIVAPSDTEDQKLRKIYAAVMTLENTRFTREHSAAENKAEGLRVKTAADIWEQKRGSDDEITRLFISMARAAGLKAYAMIVTERNRNLLNHGYLNWGQLEDEIAIVQVGGKEVYFDPGQRYCEYGTLHWMHTQVMGIRQTDKGTEEAPTPGADYKTNQMRRAANLKLGADGEVSGTIQVLMMGVEALRWRQRALRTDTQATQREFEQEMQDRVPAGVHVQGTQILALDDPTKVLMAVANVSGRLGIQTGKRVFLPASFFEARVRPLFAEQKRETPIDLHYPSVVVDKVILTLAPGLTLESAPQSTKNTFAQFAGFTVQYAGSGNHYEEERLMAIGNTFYKQEEYAQLRDFFQKAGAENQQQVVLQHTAAPAEPAGLPEKSQ